MGHEIAPLPGFYPDPDQPDRQRWWDGNEWAAIADQRGPDGPPVEPEPEIVPVTNQLAMASIVLSVGWLFFIGSVLGVICGHIAMRQIRESHGHQSGRGGATIGLITGYIGVAAGALALLVWASG